MTTNTETKISYKIDARGLQDARRQFEKTFKPDILKSYNKEAANVVKTMSALAGAQKQLNKELQGVAKAADAYKQLGKALGGVATMYGRVKQATTSYGMANRKAGTFSAGGYEAQPPGPEKMGRFGRGFFQGLAPGIGQFLDADNRGDAMKQVAGQYLGSGIRRAGAYAVGSVSSMLGGQGPLTTLLGGVPFIGGAASQAEAMTGAALQNQQARFNAFPFLGGFGTPGRTVTTGGVRTGAAAGSSMPGYDPTSSMIPFAERHANVAGASARSRAEAEGLSPDAVERQVRLAEAFGRAKATGGPIEKPTAPPTTKYIPGNNYASVGGKVGLDETAAIQQAGQIAAQIGGRGAMTPDRFKQILGAQTYGVDTGASAGLLRQMQAGRGGVGDENALARTIGDAMRAGLENSEISEYLENISNLQEQAATRGVRLSTEGLSGLATSIAGTGISGLQASRLAGQFAQVPMGIAERGVRGPADVQMARAFGYDPKNPGSYIQSLRAMESPEGLSGKRLQSFVGRLTAGVGDPDQKSFVLRRALSGMGVNASFAQTDALAAGDFSKGLGGEGMTGKDLGGRLDSGTIKDLTGMMRMQAGIQNELLSAGKNMFPAVKGLERSAAQLAQSISTWGPQVKEYITDPISALSHMLQQLINRGGTFPGPGH